MTDLHNALHFSIKHTLSHLEPWGVVGIKVATGSIQPYVFANQAVTSLLESAATCLKNSKTIVLKKTQAAQTYTLEQSFVRICRQRAENEIRAKKMPFEEYRSLIPLISSRKDKAAVWYKTFEKT